MKYRAEDHTYWEGDIRLPSVTEIINAGKDMSWINPRYTEYGTEIHELVYRIITTKKGDNEHPKETQQIIKLLHQIEPVSAEQIVVNEPLQYAGRYDILAKYQNREAIIEIKTGYYKRDHKLQLILYMLALREEQAIEEEPKLIYCRISESKGYEFTELRYTEQDVAEAIDKVYAFHFGGYNV